jgi:hypothetical protein
MARPVTGRTPDSVRQAQAADRLRKAGGRKVCANLPSDAVANLQTLRESGHRTDTAAIIAALAIAAKTVR